MKKPVIALAICLFALITAVQAEPTFKLGPIEIEVIGTSAYSNKGSKIKTRIINTSEKTIEKLCMSCAVYKDGKPIDYRSQYPIWSGGSQELLERGAEMFYTFYIFDTNIDAWDAIEFRIKSIRYKN
jgi:hypothetical protein